MNTASPQKIIIVILGAILLAAVAVALVIYFRPALNLQPFQIPESQIDNQGPAPRLPAGQAGSPASGEGEVGFDTTILTRPDYTALDSSLFVKGLLPVQPPVGAGKQNPFQ